MVRIKKIIFLHLIIYPKKNFNLFIFGDKVFHNKDLKNLKEEL